MIDNTNEDEDVQTVRLSGCRVAVVVVVLSSEKVEKHQSALACFERYVNSDVHLSYDEVVLIMEDLHHVHSLVDGDI